MDKSNYQEIQKLIEQNIVISGFDIYYLGFFSYYVPKLPLEEIFTHMRNIINLHTAHLITNEVKIDLLIMMLTNKIDIKQLQIVEPEREEDREIETKRALNEYFSQIMKIIPKYDSINKFELFYIGRFHAICPSYKIAELFLHINNLKVLVNEDLIDEEIQVDLLLKILNKKIQNNKSTTSILNIDKDHSSGNLSIKQEHSTIQTKSEVRTEDNKAETTQQVLNKPEEPASTNNQNARGEDQRKAEIEANNPFKQDEEQKEHRKANEESRKNESAPFNVKREHVSEARMDEEPKPRPVEDQGKQPVQEESKKDGRLDTRNEENEDTAIQAEEEEDQDKGSPQRKGSTTTSQEAEKEDVRRSESSKDENNDQDQDQGENSKGLSMQDEEQDAREGESRRSENDRQENSMGVESRATDLRRDSMKTEHEERGNESVYTNELGAQTHTNDNKLKRQGTNVTDASSVPRGGLESVDLDGKVESHVDEDEEAEASEGSKSRKQIEEENNEDEFSHTEAVTDQKEHEAEEGSVDLEPSQGVEQRNNRDDEDENKSNDDHDTAVQADAGRDYGKSSPSVGYHRKESEISDLGRKLQSKGSFGESSDRNGDSQKSSVSRLVKKESLDDDDISAQGGRSYGGSATNTQQGIGEVSSKKPTQEGTQQEIKDLKASLYPHIKEQEKLGTLDEILNNLLEEDSDDEGPRAPRGSARKETQNMETQEQLVKASPVNQEQKVTSNRRRSLDEISEDNHDMSVEDEGESKNNKKKARDEIRKGSNEERMDIEQSKDAQDAEEDTSQLGSQQSPRVFPESQQSQLDRSLILRMKKTSSSPAVQPATSNQNKQLVRMDSIESSASDLLAENPVVVSSQISTASEAIVPQRSGSQLQAILDAPTQADETQAEEVFEAPINRNSAQVERQTDQTLQLKDNDTKLEDETTASDVRHVTFAETQVDLPDVTQPIVDRTQEIRPAGRSGPQEPRNEETKTQVRGNQGQRAPQASNDKDCSLCKKDLTTKATKSLESCKHQFHEGCVNEYLEDKIDGKYFPIECPKPNCGVNLRLTDIMDFLDNEYVEDYIVFSLKIYVDKHDAAFCCPTPGCSYAFFRGEQNKFHCPVCKKDYCLDCRTDWHDGINCEYNKEQQKKKEKKGEKVKTDAGTVKLKKCPKCNVWTPKLAGSNIMTCECGKKFCYTCGKDREGRDCGCIRNQSFRPVVHPDLFHE